MTRWAPPPGWLFCPADRPERYRKALERADIVVLDLEDAVAPERKADARRAVTDLVNEGVYDSERTVLRIHGSGSPDHDADLQLVRETSIARVMLAKAERTDDLEPLGDLEVIALIETPLGVDNCSSIADAECVTGLMWGADDLVAGLGGTSSRFPDGRYRDVARYARSRVLVAANARSLIAIDAVYMDIPDVDGLRAECLDAVAVGFDATVAIHPTQVDVIREAYAPSAEQVRWARDLLAATNDGRGVTTFEGRMVDGPVYAQARRILARTGGDSSDRTPAPVGARSSFGGK
ncbi:HpcH/HpaI aldolase/citrate lyase family protein [Rhodococcus rhodochrous]|uniref:HpcH/HpaI aldolase/citrate lyase family protein n=1 Tax=Rhodococcus rhodochrous TaxID=1829 RepID=UPI0006866097|nr:CoA ester lyase [Rhodococcus rhodochrous]